MVDKTDVVCVGEVVVLEVGDGPLTQAAGGSSLLPTASAAGAGILIPLDHPGETD